MDVSKRFNVSSVINVSLPVDCVGLPPDISIIISALQALKQKIKA